MPATNNCITVHKGILFVQAKKLKKAAETILKKDNLSAEDTEVIKTMMDVYEVLINADQESKKLLQERCS